MTEQPARGRPSGGAGDAENATPVDQRAWLASRLPEVGRVFRGSARVRLGDARPGRRARLDALARLLQDVAEDDAADADVGDDVGWMLRRTAMVVERVPVLGEHLELATFCSATGGRWAERTTLVTGERGARVTARAVWVAIDRRSGAPARLGERFGATYGPSAGGRRVRLRLELPGPPEGARHPKGRPWPLRIADLDVWGHANNAVAWEAVEDALDEDPPEPFAAVVEHPASLLLEAVPWLLVVDDDQARHLWLVDGRDGRVLTAGWFGPPGGGGPTG
ncbi:MAG: acyl-ACP thioesterase domain-containing protein [Acidimicrobiales bacterium]